MIAYSEYGAGSIGTLTLVSDEGGAALAGCWFENDRFFDGRHAMKMERNDDLPVFQQTRVWLDRYFGGKRPDPGELPLAPQGSAFRQRVWRILLQIPYGQTMTYGAIAARLAAESGGKMSAQAVGGAVGHNPIGIIIPCHRVMGAKGNLTGFGGGLSVKVRLLEHEGVDMEGFFAPRKGTAL